MTGRELQMLRRTKGISRNDLANLLKVHPLTVYTWENSHSEIRCGSGTKLMLSSLFGR